MHPLPSGACLLCCALTAPPASPPFGTGLSSHLSCLCFPWPCLLCTLKPAPRPPPADLSLEPALGAARLTPRTVRPPLVGSCTVKRVFPGSPAGKESACNAGEPGLIPGLGRSAGEGIGYPLQYSWASLVSQLVKNPPAVQETWIRSLGWKDPLVKGTVTTPVFRPGESYGLYRPWGCKESDTTEWLSLSCC